MDSEQSILLKQATSWNDSMIGNNASDIGNFMSDDWIIIGSDGITPKADFLKLIEDGKLTHTKMTSDYDLVRVYGQTGIVISRGFSEGFFNNEFFSLYEWSTNVFFKRNEKWLCVSTMVTFAKK